MRTPKKALLIGGLLVVLGAGAWFGYARVNSTDMPEQPLKGQTTSPDQTENPKTLRLIATGDMLPHDTVNQAAKTANGYSYTPMFSRVHPYLTSGDMAFCNQESPSAPSLPVTGYPTFNAPEQFAKDLSNEGCNLINLANNHTADKGQQGIDETVDVWAGLPTLAVAGAYKNETDQQKIAYLEKGGIRFAFLSYTNCSNNNDATTYGVNRLRRDFAGRQIAEAKQQSDMIIAGTHWCRENISNQDHEQDDWAQFFANEGVDIVIGTGPHVLQPVKRLPQPDGGETVIWFSLGNFLNTQESINGLITGIAYMDISIADKQVETLSFMPVYMHYEWTEAEKAAGNLLARRNLGLYPLDQAAEPLSRSLHNTTVEAQTERVTQLLNTYTPVTMLTSKTAPSR